MKKSLVIFLVTIFFMLNTILPTSADSNVTLTVQTDAAQYVSGSTIKVSGTVLKGHVAGKGTSPMMQVKKKTNNATLEVYQWNDSGIDANGNFSTTINTTKYSNGTYSIQISAKNAQTVNAPFEITDAKPKKEITLNSDKSEYTLGEKVNVSGQVLLDNKPISSESVYVTVDREGEKVLTDRLAKTTNDGTYSFNYDTSNAKAGLYTVSVRLTDRSITKTTSFKLMASSTKPEPEKPVVPTPQPDPGPTVPSEPKPAPNAPEVNVVTSESLEIRGIAEKGSRVEITDKKKFKKESIAKADGTFSILLDKKLGAGTILYATTSVADKVSGETKIIVIDKTPPTKPVVHKISDKDRKITGTTEANAKVTVKAGKTILGTGNADKKGKYSIKINAQKAGKVLTVVAIDKAGNSSTSKKITVVDKTAPKVPSVNTVKAVSTKVTGTAEVGSKVYVKADKKVIGSAKVSKKGNFSVSIKRQKANTKLSIFAKDKAGNVGKVKIITVKKK